MPLETKRSSKAAPRAATTSLQSPARRAAAPSSPMRSLRAAADAALASGRWVARTDPSTGLQYYLDTLRRTVVPDLVAHLAAAQFGDAATGGVSPPPPVFSVPLGVSSLRTQGASTPLGQRATPNDSDASYVVAAVPYVVEQPSAASTQQRSNVGSGPVTSPSRLVTSPSRGLALTGPTAVRRREAALRVLFGDGGDGVGAGRFGGFIATRVGSSATATAAAVSAATAAAAAPEAPWSRHEAVMLLLRRTFGVTHAPSFAAEAAMPTLPPLTPLLPLAGEAEVRDIAFVAVPATGPTAAVANSVVAVAAASVRVGVLRLTARTLEVLVRGDGVYERVVFIDTRHNGSSCSNISSDAPTLGRRLWVHRRTHIVVLWCPNTEGIGGSAAAAAASQSRDGRHSDAGFGLAFRILGGGSHVPSVVPFVSARPLPLFSASLLNASAHTARKGEESDVPFEGLGLAVANDDDDNDDDNDEEGRAGPRGGRLPLRAAHDALLRVLDARAASQSFDARSGAVKASAAVATPAASAPQLAARARTPKSGVSPSSSSRARTPSRVASATAVLVPSPRIHRWARREGLLEDTVDSALAGVRGAPTTTACRSAAPSPAVGTNTARAMRVTLTRRSATPSNPRMTATASRRSAEPSDDVAAALLGALAAHGSRRLESTPGATLARPTTPATPLRRPANSAVVAEAKAPFGLRAPPPLNATQSLPSDEPAEAAEALRLQRDNDFLIRELLAMGAALDAQLQDGTRRRG